MRITYFGTCFLILLSFSSFNLAQPPGITMEMINTTLPLEGAPLAITGKYEVISEAAFNSPGHRVYRPQSLATFPSQDNLPVLVWGNGGCSQDSSTFSGFLSTIASHGFIVISTAAIAGEDRRQANANDLIAAINWAEEENKRVNSPLNSRIDISQIAAMGQSCGGFLALSVGTDPRVDTIGLLNSGVQAPNAQNPATASTAMFADVQGPILFINGHERDFMMETSHNNFALINHVPTFYGARHQGGHLATVTHPGGGEFANVVTNWLLYHFKEDSQAGTMFKGTACTLCNNPNWDTEAKGMD